MFGDFVQLTPSRFRSANKAVSVPLKDLTVEAASWGLLVSQLPHMRNALARQ
jgi:hypothetical protein